MVARNGTIYSLLLDNTEMLIDDEDQAEESRTELDSHANMPVVGRNAYVLADTGKTVDVSPYTPDYKPVQVKVVDAGSSMTLLMMGSHTSW